MVLAGIGKASHGNITIPNGFYFKDTPPGGNGVEGCINRFQECKDLGWFSNARPCGKTGNVGK